MGSQNFVLEQLESRILLSVHGDIAPDGEVVEPVDSDPPCATELVLPDEEGVSPGGAAGPADSESVEDFPAMIDWGELEPCPTATSSESGSDVFPPVPDSETPVSLPPEDGPNEEVADPGDCLENAALPRRI